MNVNRFVTKVEKTLAQLGLPAGPDNLINHRVILGVVGGSLGALIGWLLTEPFQEDFSFWRDFLILSSVGFFVCLLIMSLESLFERDLKTVARNLLVSAAYSIVIIVPTVIVVKLLITPGATTIAPSTKVFVLDTSGSMEGAPLDALKKALNSYVTIVQQRGIGGSTKLGCVSFDTDARVISEPTTDYPAFKEKTNRLRADGLTNMPAGLEKALGLIGPQTSRGPAGAINKLRGSGGKRKAGSRAAEVFLVSDGQPILRPLLVRTQEELRKAINEAIEAVKQTASVYRQHGIAINTIGAGDQYNRSLMEEIAAMTGGTFVPADDIAQLVPIMQKFAEQGLAQASTGTGSALSFWSRGAGWALIGMAIGLCSSFLRRSSSKKFLGLIQLPEISPRMLIFALIGGLIGGGLGALFFDILQYGFSLVGVQSGVFNRLVGFLILGAFVGFFVNLAQAAAKKAWIRIRRGAGEGRLYVLDKSPMILGRSELVDIPIFLDLSITEKNLKLVTQDGGTEIDSLGHENLRVNGLRTLRAELKHMDTFTVGSTEFIYLNKLAKLTD